MSSPIFDHVPGMKRAAPLASVQAAELTRERFFTDYMAQSRPVLIKGAVAHWPARTKWREPDYLKSRSGHHQVYYYPHENYSSQARQLRDQVMIPLGKALERLRAPETRIGFCGTATPVEVMDDLPGFSFLDKVPPAFFYPHIRYFLYRNAGTTWHYHPFDETLMCQVIGAKQVGLVGLDNPHHRTLRDIFFREDYYED
ncbi:MAG TPA: cupin-like domain-containing protein, partial [Rhizomicrobium sp.]|nr:cupin-like domain-containing protein [Rhizomicrobium sp.]